MEYDHFFLDFFLSSSSESEELLDEEDDDEEELSESESDELELLELEELSCFFFENFFIFLDTFPSILRLRSLVRESRYMYGRLPLHKKLIFENAQFFWKIF